MIRVGITGAGAATAGVLIKSLRMVKKDKFHLTGFDPDEHAFGFKFMDEHYVLPSRAGADEYLEFLCAACLKGRIQVLVPLIDDEMLLVGERRQKLEEVGTRVMLPSNESITDCLDKLRTFEILGEQTYVRTRLAPEPEALQRSDFPIILKPRSGMGSRDIYRCNDKTDYEVFSKRVKSGIIQSLLYEPEFTIDVLSDMEGTGLMAIPRRRIRIKAGLTWQGVIERNKEMEEFSLRAAEKLRLAGPSCLQIRYTTKGEARIFEVNPRIGGTTILSVLAGANIPYMAVRLLLGEELSLPRKIKDGLFISRFFDEVTF